MDKRSELLNELKAGRPEPATTRHVRWGWWLSAVAVVVALPVAFWVAPLASDAVSVDVVVAEPASTPDQQAAGSVLDASGYIIARRQATVSSKTTGKVVQVLIEEAQYVRSDQIIARLDDSNVRAQLAQVEAQLQQAIANSTATMRAFEDARPIFEQSKVEFARGLSAAQALDNATAHFHALETAVDVARQAVVAAQASVAVAERNLEDTVVRAPFAGVVTVKAAQEGEIISPISAGGGFTRTGIGTIVDMTSLEVEVDVGETFINRVHAGRPVTVTLNAYPGWQLSGSVGAIVARADRAKATIKVRVLLDVRDPRILPDMAAHVSFLEERSPAATTTPHTSGVVVPSDAVHQSGDTPAVFVVHDDIVERRTVRVDGRTAKGQIIVSGLTPGTRLAVADFSRLKDGAHVRVVNDAARRASKGGAE